MERTLWQNHYQTMPKTRLRKSQCRHLDNNTPNSTAQRALKLLRAERATSPNKRGNSPAPKKDRQPLVFRTDPIRRTRKPRGRLTKTRLRQRQKTSGTTLQPMIQTTTTPTTITNANSI